MGWPASALESSASVPQPDEGPASLGERQQQQYGQAVAQSVGRAPDPGNGASPARAPGQDARWRSSPGHAPQQPLEAVPEGEPCLLEMHAQIRASLHPDEELNINVHTIHCSGSAAPVALYRAEALLSEQSALRDKTGAFICR